MRHRVAGKKLNRSSKQRKALLNNLATSLINNGKIETTLAKAKYVRGYVEKLITRAKLGSDFNNVKFMHDKLDTNEAIRNLLTKVAGSVASSTGGYTRITRTGNRSGDNAEMARIEIIKKEEKKPAVRAPRKSTATKTTLATSVEEAIAATTQPVETKEEVKVKAETPKVKAKRVVKKKDEAKE